MRLHIDYETRSPVNLVQCGQYVYAEHPHTSALVAAWAIDDQPFRLWNILSGEPIPIELKLAFLDPTVTLVAHNASFERVISMAVGPRQGFIPQHVRDALKDPMRWTCTAARAASAGLPRALEKVGTALYLNIQKDMEGHDLMMRMCQPCGVYDNGSPIWIQSAEQIKRLGEYCLIDGEVEREVDRYLPEFSQMEHEVWATTELMNDTGLMVDEAMLDCMIPFVSSATEYLNRRIVQLTNGRVPKITNPKAIAKWLLDAHEINVNGRIGKWVINGLLEDDALPDIVREVLILRRDGGKSSTAKFSSIKRRLNSDARLRGALLYAGAAATSRWSSRGAQVQNLVRSKTVKDVEGAISTIMQPGITFQYVEQKYGPPMVVAAELARPLFVASEEYWLSRGDYSQIEARVGAGLAGDHAKMQAFRDYDNGTGPDIYIITAAGMYHVPAASIDKDDPRRQSGKVSELACGFGGGKNALLAMAKIYNLKLSEAEAEESKERWREANPLTVNLWYNLERAAMKCMTEPVGSEYPVEGSSGISFRQNGTVLCMRLPSGRGLNYWYPKVEAVETPWGEVRDGITYYAEDSQTHQWQRHKLYGGLICENAVQATARDIMAIALVKLAKRGLRPVLTVHDEAVCQLLKARYPTADEATDAVLKVMLEPPGFCLKLGIPLAADGSSAQRYIKV